MPGGDSFYSIYRPYSKNQQISNHPECPQGGGKQQNPVVSEINPCVVQDGGDKISASSQEQDPAGAKGISYKNTTVPESIS